MIGYEKIAALAIGLSEDELEKDAYEYKPDSAARRSAATAFKMFRQGQEAAHPTRDEVLGALRKKLAPSHGIIENLMKSTPKGLASLGRGAAGVIEHGGTPIPPGSLKATKNLLTRIREAGMSAANPLEMIKKLRRGETPEAIKILKETAGDLAHHPGNHEYAVDFAKKLPYGF